MPGQMPRRSSASLSTRLLACLLFGLLARAAQAQTSHGLAEHDARSAVLAPWTLLTTHDDATLAGDPWIRPTKGQALKLDIHRMRSILQAAPMEFTEEARIQPMVLELPDPLGRMRPFAVWETRVLHPPAAAAFPSIRTFGGRSLDEPAVRLAAELTEFGFQAMVRAPNRPWAIDPVNKRDALHMTSYFTANLEGGRGFACLAPEPAPSSGEAPVANRGPGDLGMPLSTYRLAVTATGDYSQYVCGVAPPGVPVVVSAITTVVSRVNLTYEEELQVRFQYVPDADLVFLDPETDGFAADHFITLAEVIDRNQSLCSDPDILGTALHDLGILFHKASFVTPYLSLQNSGRAEYRSVCRDELKARGAAQAFTPLPASAWLEVIMHEMGHMFGAHHTFAAPSCSASQWSGEAAYEPGAGLTLMSYADNCDASDNYGDRRLYFHPGSFEQVRAFISPCWIAPCERVAIVGCCGECQTIPGYSRPTIHVAPDTNSAKLPRFTPFELTGWTNSASPIVPLYSWSQHDRARSPRSLADGDDGLGPINRWQPPQDSGTRFVPDLERVLAGIDGEEDLDPADLLPTLDRSEYWWQLTARDGVSAETRNVYLSVAEAAGPFRITSQNQPALWTTGPVMQRLTWNVAGTDANGINCGQVQILFSTDGGYTFPIVLDSSTANDGSADINVPAIETTNGRIKIKAIGNIFYDINDADIAIDSGTVDLTASYRAEFFEPSPLEPPTWRYLRQDSVTRESTVSLRPSLPDYSEPPEDLLPGCEPASGTFAVLAEASHGVLKASAECIHVIGTCIDPSTGEPGVRAESWGSVWGTARTRDRILVTAPPPLERVTLGFRLRLASHVTASRRPIADFPSSGTASAAASYEFGPSGRVTGDTSTTVVSSVSSTVTGVESNFGPGVVAGAITVEDGTVVSILGSLSASALGSNFTAAALAANSAYLEIWPIDTGTILVAASGHDYAPAPCPAPSVAIQPIGVSVCGDGAATLTIQGGGLGPFLYRWRFRSPGGADIVIREDGAVSDPQTGVSFTATGARSNALTLTNVRPGAPGQAVNLSVTGDVITACGATPSDSVEVRACPADFNCSGVLSVQDIFDFLAGYFSNDPRADFNGSGTTSVQDIFDFLAAYFAGCG